MILSIFQLIRVQPTVSRNCGDDITPVSDDLLLCLVAEKNNLKEH